MRGGGMHGSRDEPRAMHHDHEAACVRVQLSMSRLRDPRELIWPSDSPGLLARNAGASLCAHTATAGMVANGLFWLNLHHV